MSFLKELIHKSEQIQPDKIDKILFGFIRNIEAQLLEDNREQILDSKDTNNNTIYSKKRKRSTYSFATELITGGRKKAGDTYNLYDTGSALKGLYIDIKEDKAEFRTSDSKEKLLVSDYGNIFGLTDQKLSENVDKLIKPLLVDFLIKNMTI